MSEKEKLQEKLQACQAFLAQKSFDEKLRLAKREKAVAEAMILLTTWICGDVVKQILRTPVKKLVEQGLELDYQDDIYHGRHELIAGAVAELAREARINVLLQIQRRLADLREMVEQQLQRRFLDSGFAVRVIMERNHDALHPDWSLVVDVRLAGTAESASEDVRER